MGRTTCSQQTTMRKLVVVKLGRMSNPLVNGGPGATILRAIHVAVALREHTDVMSLSDDDQSDLGLDPDSSASILDPRQF